MVNTKEPRTRSVNSLPAAPFFPVWFYDSSLDVSHLSIRRAGILHKASDSTKTETHQTVNTVSSNAHTRWTSSREKIKNRQYTTDSE